MIENLIKIENLSISYDESCVLNKISFEIPSGVICGVLGPNGAGKTTLLNAIFGLIKKDSGDILIKNDKILSYVPQTQSIDWDFPATVFDIVYMGTFRMKNKLKRTKRKEITLEKIKLLGLEQYKNTQINKLSGGQKQRVFLARALAQNADIYFFDEPFKGIDITTEKLIVDILKDMQSQGKTMIVVHHNLQTVSKYFDYVLMINRDLIACGDIKSCFNAENIMKTYGNGAIYD